MFETNVLGALRTVQAVTPGMRERGAGVIVNISSVQGRVTSPLSGVYSASKHALEALSEAMHLELAHFGIRTVLIEPGFIAPGMKQADDLPRPTIYEPLFAEWEGADVALNAEGRPGPEIVADATHAILTRPARACTGHFFIDDEVLRSEGVDDFSAYRRPEVAEDDLIPDFFL